MGSSDKKNITQKLVSAFKKSNLKFNLIIVLGKFYSYEKKIQTSIKDDKRFLIKKDPKNFLKLLSCCKLSVIEFGITAYEAAALHVPTLVITHSNENDYSAKKIQKYGLFNYLGKYDKINYSKLVNFILETSKNSSLLKKMKINSCNIDNKGNTRIAIEIIKIIKKQSKNHLANH